MFGNSVLTIWGASREYKRLIGKLTLADVLEFTRLELSWTVEKWLLNRKWLREHISAQIQLNLLAERRRKGEQ